MADHFIVTGLDLWTLPVFQKAVFFVNLRLNSKHWIQNSTKQALETIIRKKNNLTIQSFCALFLLVPSKIKQESLRKKDVKIAVLLLGAPIVPRQMSLLWNGIYSVLNSDLGLTVVMQHQKPAHFSMYFPTSCEYFGFQSCMQSSYEMNNNRWGGEKKNKSFTWTVSIINVTSQAKLSFKKPLSSSVF